MTQVLNIDQLKVTRDIVLGGRTRGVRSMTVGQFIATEDYERRMKEAKNDIERVKILVELVHGYIEDTAKDELLQLDLVQLMALLNFIRGKDAMEITNGGEKDEDQGNAEAPAEAPAETTTSS